MTKRTVIVLIAFAALASCPSSPRALADPRWDFDDFVCGVHIGGRWGTTQLNLNEVPDEYFAYLDALGASWVGISISITVEGSMDSSIEAVGPEEDFQTYSDSELRALIQALRGHGLQVYLTLAFEHLGDGPEGQQVSRWQLGDPSIYNEDSRVWKEYWPWDPDHPAHSEFVDEFFASYTQIAVSYASLCEEEGVELFSLGTETDRLFRTNRTGSTYWTTDFREQLTDMVESVRSVYSGLITYDMVWASPTKPMFRYLYDLWGDLGLDAIGISAYYHLGSERSVDDLPASEQDLVMAWRSRFSDCLAPLATAYPYLPILFLELGYTDSVGSAADPNRQEYSSKTFIDRNNNGLDDGEEEQAAVYSALFQAVRELPGLLDGVFLWGDMIATDRQWESHFGYMRTFSVRQKLAQLVVSEAFSALSTE